jgi:glucose/arabinose dehydrogenase
MKTMYNLTFRHFGSWPLLFVRGLLLLLLLALLLAASSRKLQAQTYPAGFSQVLVTSGLGAPTALAFAPDGRIFVCLQTGALRVIKNGALLPTPFVTLTVNSVGERGLLGIALDPNFASNHYVYLYHTVPSPLHNRISRFTANGDVALAGSTTTVLDLDPLSAASNHNGGAMHFAADGTLYVAVGENANGNNSQNLNTTHGKLLRINPDGSVPPGNPYTGATDSEQKKRVWAYGLRNPYTFSFQPGTGRLFVNDVGQNTWEEVNDATTGGRNFGWPFAEGLDSNPAFVNPVFVYPHSSLSVPSGCALTGGTFFNPSLTAYPARFVGQYFLVDLCSRWLNVLDLSTGTAVRSDFGLNIPGQPLSIETGPDGNLYFLSIGTASLYRIVYNASQAPVITKQPVPLTVAQGATATLTASVAGSATLDFQWLHDGTDVAGANTQTLTLSNVRPTDAGQYELVVSNAAGTVVSNAVQLTVLTPNNAPQATLLTPAAGSSYIAGRTISFSGEGNDPEDGPLPASAFTWQVNFYHDGHVHDGRPFQSGKGGRFQVPNTGETATNVFYRILLTVKDAAGASTTVFRDVVPQVSTLQFNTQPAGLALTLDSQPLSLPATLSSVTGMLRTIDAPSPQLLGGQQYVFDFWKQGGSATQTFATPVDNALYTAIFRPANQQLMKPPAKALAAPTAEARLYPNPSATVATLDLSSLPAATYSIYLTDLQGQPVLSTTGQGGQTLDLPVRTLPAGIYQLRLQSTGWTRTLRLVKP